MKKNHHRRFVSLSYTTSNKAKGDGGAQKQRLGKHFRTPYPYHLWEGHLTQEHLAAWGLLHDHKHGGWTKRDCLAGFVLTGNASGTANLRVPRSAYLLDQHEKAESMSQWEDGEGLE